MGRPLTFKDRSATERKHRDTAVAWVTAQHPGRIIEAANVPAVIVKELRAHGFKTTQEHVALSINYLERDGYGAKQVIGRRTVMFMIDEDVEIPDPPFVVAERVKAGLGTPPTNGSSPAPAPGPRRPPVPGKATAPAWLPDLSGRLAAWWTTDPAAADQWAAEVMESLS